MKTSDFYYDLPPELIAQDPLEDRSSSRLMVLNKETGEVSHHVFREVTSFLEPGDCLVLNNTKVIPARLMGVREETGGAVEVLLLKRRADDVWERWFVLARRRGRARSWSLETASCTQRCWRW